MKTAFYVIISAIMCAITVIFAMQNGQTIDVRFLSWNFQSPVALLMITCLVLGIALTLLMSVPGRIRRAVEARTNRNKIAQLEKSLQEAQKNAELLSNKNEQAYSADTAVLPPMTK